MKDFLWIKPLYYGYQSGIFLFGSELKALMNHPGFIREIDRVLKERDDFVKKYNRHEANRYKS